MKIISLILLVLVLSVGIVLAQNDPGHDTLYIEQQGDSELNGTFNVSENFTVRGGEITIDNQFEIRGDGSTPTSNSNSIIGDQDDFIRINSLGNGRELRLLDQASTGTVHVGYAPTSAFSNLNVSDDVFIQGNVVTVDTNFEFRTNGTIPGSSINSIVVNGTSSRRMWLTSDAILLAAGTSNGVVHIGHGGSDLVELNVTGNLTVLGTNGFINGGEICTVTNGLCGAGGSNVSGTGTTNFIAKWTGTSAIGDSTIFDDGTNVGINTTAMNATFHVRGTGNFSDVVWVADSQVCTQSNGLCGDGGADGTGGWTNTTTVTGTSLSVNVSNSTGTNSILYVNTTSGRVGIRTESPDAPLDVQVDSGLAAILQTQETGEISLLRLQNNNGGGNAAGLSFFVGGSERARILSYDTGMIIGSSSNIMELRTSSITRLYLDTVGRVGVNNTSPVSTLHVEGNASTVTNMRVGTNLTVAGGGIYDSAGTSRIEMTTGKVVITLG